MNILFVVKFGEKLALADWLLNYVTKLILT